MREKKQDAILNAAEMTKCPQRQENPAQRKMDEAAGGLRQEGRLFRRAEAFRGRDRWEEPGGNGREVCGEFGPAP